MLFVITVFKNNTNNSIHIIVHECVGGRTLYKTLYVWTAVCIKPIKHL